MTHKMYFIFFIGFLFAHGQTKRSISVDSPHVKRRELEPQLTVPTMPAAGSLTLPAVIDRRQAKRTLDEVQENVPVKKTHTYNENLEVVTMMINDAEISAEDVVHFIMTHLTQEEITQIRNKLEQSIHDTSSPAASDQIMQLHDRFTTILEMMNLFTYQTSPVPSTPASSLVQERTPQTRHLFTRNYTLLKKFLDSLSPADRKIFMDERECLNERLQEMNKLLRSSSAQSPELPTPLKAVQKVTRRQEYEPLREEVIVLHQDLFPRECWSHVLSLNGYTIFQRDSLIDLDYYVHSERKTNRQLMAQGRAPYTRDGNPVILHHIIQEDPGPLMEVSKLLHQWEYALLHFLKKTEEGSGVGPQRAKFEAFKKIYWKTRLAQLEEKEQAKMPLSESHVVNEISDTQRQVSSYEHVLNEEFLKKMLQDLKITTTKAHKENDNKTAKKRVKKRLQFESM